MLRTFTAANPPHGTEGTKCISKRWRRAQEPAPSSQERRGTGSDIIDAEHAARRGTIDRRCSETLGGESRGGTKTHLDASSDIAPARRAAPPRPSPSWRGAARTLRVAARWASGSAPSCRASRACSRTRRRIRPDPLHHSTYSFPSPHTASATLLAGAFPAVLHRRPRRRRSASREVDAVHNHVGRVITALTAPADFNRDHSPHARRRRAGDGGRSGHCAGGRRRGRVRNSTAWWECRHLPPRGEPHPPPGAFILTAGPRRPRLLRPVA